ncbi:hypothetical protein BST81_21095 [Leptolyngbya sp. 'hensonii']|uniref:hypothetical protein n=1 Tax=Leptolyngbya sp. 'hensonii' TaxID=1922337 RepID=UPI00094F7583|nr:hypothetical protein [Leptolyngbya sp. 'hensonii']OLP16477.1 hypothetical protein BST81_21095 [Leptolyngbya sp. 'hensonii']
MTHSEPSRLDRIEAVLEAHNQQIESNSQQIELLFTALLQTNEVQRSMLDSIQRLSDTVERVAQRQAELAEEQRQQLERQRKSDERFNVLLEEVRFLIRRLDDRPA